MITRRSMLVALGLNALAFGAPLRNTWPAPLPGKVLRLGLLDLIRDKFDPETYPLHRALLDSLRAEGYELGRNVLIEFRSPRGNPEQMSAMAAELVRLKVDILVTLATVSTQAAMEATKTIPIVAIGVSDPVGTGLVASLARPGGNLTGMAINSAEISAKRVQLLKEAVPKLSLVAVLWNSSLKSMELQYQQVETAAPVLGLRVLSLRVSSSDDFDRAFAAIKERRPGGLIVLFGPLRGNDLPRVVQFVTGIRLPTVFELGRACAAAA